MFKIGNHLSSSKGYEAMGKMAVKLGANTFAFFTRNPRGGKAKEIDPKDVEAFLQYATEYQIQKLVAHAPYTLNPCSADPALREFAKNTFADDLKRMEYTPGNYYNFHPGSHVKQGVDVGIDYIAQMLNEVLTQEQTTTVLLETMAGKGSEVGRTFEEIRAILDRVELQDKMGVCLDTCHVWDGGYDIVGDLDGVLDEFDRVIGLERLKAVHLNDSMNERGSHKDRHARIGEGKIGLEALAGVINHPVLKELPFILDKRIEEIGFGDMEGKPWRKTEDFPGDDNIYCFFEHPDQYVPPKGGESLTDLAKRCADFMQDICNRPELEEKTILIATHGAATRGLLNSLRNWTMADFWGGRVAPNCGVAIVESHHGQAKLIAENITYYH